VEQGVRLDMFQSHCSLQDGRELDLLVPGNAKVSLFREPFDRMISAFTMSENVTLMQQRLDNLKANKPIDDYVCDVAVGCVSGMDIWMLQHHHVPLNKFDSLDFVALTEEYDKSLVMMRRQFNWTTRDIAYVRIKETKNPEAAAVRAEIETYLKQPEDKRSATSQELLDYQTGGDEALVYNTAKTKFQAQWDALSLSEQESVQTELNSFQQLIEHLDKCCDDNLLDAYCLLMKEDTSEWGQRNFMEHQVAALGNVISSQSDRSAEAPSICSALVLEWPTYGGG
jgi:hypothetical protein